ncbi:hypothetical protein [Halohasta litorea]|uniref:Uncharacterized protein n=1 Tax=Halohasta litorea TaxID=869891 RepID=A0ABD6D8Y4_9EURY|nr:hypothetical protein [Halohasta litorea]
MRGELRSRLGMLVVLTIVGLTAAGIGISYGIPTPDATGDDAAEFVVSEQNVTFSDRNRTVTVTDDLSNVTTVEVEETESGRYRVNAERRQPLTDADREHAIEVARNNRTVSERIDEMDRVEFSVDPIYKLETTEVYRSDNITSVNTSGNVSVYRFETNESNSREGSVVVDREPSYVEDRADVGISDPTDNRETRLKYSVTVDVANGTVIDVTDWAAIRQSRPTITGTEVDGTRTNSTESIQIP